MYHSHCVSRTGEAFALAGRCTGVADAALATWQNLCSTLTVNRMFAAVASAIRTASTTYG